MRRYVKNNIPIKNLNKIKVLFYSKFNISKVHTDENDWLFRMSMKHANNITNEYINAEYTKKMNSPTVEINIIKSNINDQEELDWLSKMSNYHLYGTTDNNVDDNIN